MNLINRLYTIDIYNQFRKLIPISFCWRWDNTTNQHFVEIQDCHFIADSEYIVEHNKVIYDSQWYIDNYDPLVNKNNQLDYCINILEKDPYTRKAIIYMGNSNDNSICTISMNMFLNNDKLAWIVNMRSNNIVKYTTDYIWQKLLAFKVCHELSKKLNRNIELENIYWNACSMHVYEEDFELFLKNIYS